MRTANLGSLGNVSRLTLGGGGIGQGWGETSREEAIATIKLAIDGGITVIDTAPLYRNCEAIVGETFEGKLPAGIKITSKCRLGSPPAGEVEAKPSDVMVGALPDVEERAPRNPAYCVEPMISRRGEGIGAVTTHESAKIA